MTDKQSAEPSKEALEFAALWHKNALRDNLHEERLARAVQNLLNTEIAKARLEEAKWWAAGYHEGHGSFIADCVQCQRIAALEQAAGKGK